MPDISSSLPQIQPEKPKENFSSAASASFSPAVNSDLPGQESASLGKGSNDGGFVTRLQVKKIVALFALVLIFIVSYAVYFVLLPNTQAKSYVEQASGDFGIVKEKLKAAKSEESEGADIGSSFEISNGVYFEVAQSLVYVYSSAILDAKEDLEDVKTIQLATADARRGREKYRVGSKVGDLDRDYREYLDKLDEGVNSLYLSENFKIEIFEAIGEEQARELDKLLELYNEATARERKIEYISKLSTLTEQSAGRLKSLGVVPDDLRVFYEQIIASYDDMAAVFFAVRKDYEVGSADGDSAAVAKLSELGLRHSERSAKVQAENIQMMQNSGAKKAFLDAVVLEQKLNAEFERLRKDFNLTEGEKTSDQ